MTPAWLLCYLASELYVDNKDTNWSVYFIPYVMLLNLYHNSVSYK
jgi:hypothetical protein